MLALAGCASDAAADRALSRSSSGKEIKALVARQAMDLGVSVSLALAVAHAESNFDASAKSSKGARGVMQIMPATSAHQRAPRPAFSEAPAQTLQRTGRSCPFVL
jgi:soluble lytic murein transglycosylase